MFCTIVLEDGIGRPASRQHPSNSQGRRHKSVLDEPFVYALPKITPNTMARMKKRLMKGNAAHSLNSLGLTGFAMLDGLSVR
jgi:hypothetical protein